MFAIDFYRFCSKQMIKTCDSSPILLQKCRIALLRLIREQLQRFLLLSTGSCRFSRFWVFNQAARAHANLDYETFNWYHRKGVVDLVHSWLRNYGGEEEDNMVIGSLNAFIWNRKFTDKKICKKISPEDIQWEGKDPGISRQAGYGVSGHVMGRSVGRDGGPTGGKGRGVMKGQPRKDFPPLQNGIGKKGSDEIQLLHTDNLIKEVERVFGVSNPDPLEIEKAKKVLKEHEQALADAIARLADISDGEGWPFLAHGPGIMSSGSDGSRIAGHKIAGGRYSDDRQTEQRERSGMLIVPCDSGGFVV
ncbi:hypothetical protein TEA_023120 [Camellia sinensis var. sinensis]|uniref:Uncharacterized protein n=1 Tax=Camellia sinensis var. sinensis TaxID=542762 RepID=A0A4S4E5D6_CAMSN|nr:hypothetical protein TEA_023120 [Camellia sinensis var. sinensis]